MGASDWAAHTVLEFDEVFGVGEERALRITNLVRAFVSDPAYDDVLAERGTDQRRAQQQAFIDEVTRTLQNQAGNTIEERWNNLMDEREIPERVEQPVYLEPWTEIDDDPKYTMGLTRTRDDSSERE